MKKLKTLLPLLFVFSIACITTTNKDTIMQEGTAGLYEIKIQLGCVIF
jgi:hypothetical protein